MILTEKETNAIEDLKTQEQACIEKYTKYSNQAKDPVLKELFEEIARDEQAMPCSCNLSGIKNALFTSRYLSSLIRGRQISQEVSDT